MTAVVVVGCSLVADHYLNYGYYTDSTLSVLRQIQHAFGW